MKIKIGDILESDAQTLINTVNCVGVMGKGIALEFKKRFPEMYEEYVDLCNRHVIMPGQPYLHRELFPPQIINFPTKDHWRSASKLTDIENGLAILLNKYKEWNVTSLAIPPLGCGNGQLEWTAVGPMIYQTALQMDIPVEIYAPYGTAPLQLTEEFLSSAHKTKLPATTRDIAPLNLAAWIALIEILYRIKQQPYHWPVGRVMFQKIAYIATTKGLPTGLSYRRGSYGPYSDDLKSIVARLINNNLLKERQSGNMFIVEPGKEFLTVRQNHIESLELWESIISKTTDLFARINTVEAEIVATVIYTANSLGKTTGRMPVESEVLDSVMQWKVQRQPPLVVTEVASTIRNLGMLRWLQLKIDPDLPLNQKDPLFI